LALSLLVATVAAALFVSSLAAGKPPPPPAGTLAFTSPTPLPYDFGSVLVGETESQQFTLTFTGSGTTGPLAVWVSGSAFSMPIATNGCLGKSLGSGKPTCTVTVQYGPTDTGQTDTATLHALSLRAGTATATATGTPTTPVSASPATLDFGELSLSAIWPPRVKEIKITNNTESTVWMVDATPPAAFPVWGSSFMGCYYPGIGPHATCTGQIQFWPTAAQAYSGWFTTTWMTGTQSEPVPIGTTETWVTGTGTSP
jgi:hypothetical protein